MLLGCDGILVVSGFVPKLLLVWAGAEVLGAGGVLITLEAGAVTSDSGSVCMFVTAFIAPTVVTTVWPGLVTVAGSTVDPPKGSQDTPMRPPTCSVTVGRLLR